MERGLNSASLGLFQVELLSRFSPSSVYAIDTWNLNAGLYTLQLLYHPGYRALFQTSYTC